MDPRHDRHPGGMAGRGGAVGIGKVDRSFGQTLEVGSLHTRVVVERTDVVIQVVDCDEENVGLGGKVTKSGKNGYQAQEQE